MNPYYEQTVLNADPTELINMVYQRAICCVREAREHLQQKRIAERSAAITKAYTSIGELLAALRPEMAPELAARLQGLYFYMQQRLLDANMQQADLPLAEVLGLLTTMAEAWAGVVGELKRFTAAPEGKVHEGRAQAGMDRGRWLETGQEERSGIAVSA